MSVAGPSELFPGSSGPKTENAQQAPPKGILKASWLAKHRTRRPAVVIALVQRDDVFGDPAGWTTTCALIDSLKGALRGRPSKLIVVLVQATKEGEITDDRVAPLRRRAELEAKFFLTFTRSEEDQSMGRLAKAAYEQAVVAYRERGRLVKARMGRPGYPQLHVRNGFKAGAFAEFRQDWASAVKYYRMAFFALQEIAQNINTAAAGADAGPPSSAQQAASNAAGYGPGGISDQLLVRAHEIRCVAQLINLKLCTLLLHSSTVTDAIRQFKLHVGTYRRLLVGSSLGAGGEAPGSLRAGVAEFLRCGWLCSQFQIFAELLQTRVHHSALSPTDREQQPAFYYAAAAHHAKERRRAYELVMNLTAAGRRNSGSSIALAGDELINAMLANGAVGAHASSADASAGAGDPSFGGAVPDPGGALPPFLDLQPSPFVGQLVAGSTDGHPVVDKEFAPHAIGQERSVRHSTVAIELLTKAHEGYKRLRAGRVIYYLASEMAREYAHAREYASAKRLLDSVAAIYRREGWTLLLAAALSALRECAQRLGAADHYLEYSLELASLGAGGLRGGEEMEHHAIQCAAIQDIAVSLLRDPHSGVDGLPNITASLPLEFELKEGSPLRGVVSAAVAFHTRQLAAGAQAEVSVALRANLPRPLRLGAVELVFNQEACNAIAVHRENVEGGGGKDAAANQHLLPDDLSPLGASAAESLLTDDDSVVMSTAPLHDALHDALPPSTRPKPPTAHLTLQPGKWTRVTFPVVPRETGRLECTAIFARISPSAALRWPVTDKFPERLFAGPGVPAGSSGWDATMPFSDFDAAIPRLHGCDVTEGRAAMDLMLAHAQPALVGEPFPIELLLTLGYGQGGPLRIRGFEAAGGGIGSPGGGGGGRMSSEGFGVSHGVAMLEISGGELLKLDPGTGAIEPALRAGSSLVSVYVESACVPDDSASRGVAGGDVGMSMGTEAGGIGGNGHGGGAPYGSGGNAGVLKRLVPAELAPGSKGPERVSFPLEPMHWGERRRVGLFLRARGEGSITLKAKVSYMKEVPGAVPGPLGGGARKLLVETATQVTFALPFGARHRFLSATSQSLLLPTAPVSGTVPSPQSVQSLGAGAAPAAGAADGKTVAAAGSAAAAAVRPTIPVDEDSVMVSALLVPVADVSLDVLAVDVEPTPGLCCDVERVAMGGGEGAGGRLGDWAEESSGDPFAASSSALAPRDHQLWETATSVAAGLSSNNKNPNNQSSCGPPGILSKGDIHTALFIVRAHFQSPGMPVGRLRVTWRRAPHPGSDSTPLHAGPEASARLGITNSFKGLSIHGPVGVQLPIPSSNALESAPLVLPASASGPSAPGPSLGDPVTPLAQQPLPSGVVAGASNESPGLDPYAPLVTYLELPQVAVARVPLAVVTHRPAYAVLAEPFPLTIVVHNSTELLQELAVSIVDTPGLVYAGDKVASVVVLPQHSATLRYTMVPVLSGMLLLPDVRIIATRYNARLHPSSLNRQLQVFPSSPVAE